MTRPKRVFAEMLAKAKKDEHVDVDEICDTLTLADIMYELKKLEKEEEEAAAAAATAEPEIPPVEEPPKFVQPLMDFWSRVSSE
jgi:hypothetical protein